MRVVGNCEYGLLLYRDKLPKFRNNGKMIFNCFDYGRRGSDEPQLHPTQKPIDLLQRLIDIFTDPGDVVIDPVAGSGSTLIAATLSKRQSYGFEIKKNFHKEAKEWIEKVKLREQEIDLYGFAKTEVSAIHPTLF